MEPSTSSKEPVTPKFNTTMMQNRHNMLDYGLDDVITLLVGGGENDEAVPTEFVVHKNVLCLQSTFFEAACKIEWMGEKKVLRLPVEDPELVQAMVSWMYRNKIRLPRSIDSPKHGEEKTMFFAKLWILAEKYDVRILKNHAVDEIWCELDEITETENVVDNFPVNVVRYVYTNTLGEEHVKGVRRIFTHFALARSTSGDIHRLAKCCPAEFIIDMFKENLDCISEKVAIDLNNCCQYHDHLKGERCKMK